MARVRVAFGQRLVIDRVRAGWGRWLSPLGTFSVSAAAAAVVTLTALSPDSLDVAVPAPPASPFSVASGIMTPPEAFATRRVLPLAQRRWVTRWAPVLRATTARRAPGFDSQSVARVGTRTGDDTTNIVVADAEAQHRGVLWERVRLAVLPNGSEGWVPRSALGGWSFVNTRLVVDRARLTARLIRAGQVIFRARVAVGGLATPTPPGRFYVLDRLSGFSRPFYGPLAFGTNARSPTLTDWPAGGVVGIHGTDRPDLIPGRVSHGCIRLTNAAILRLGKLMPMGTAVVIK